MDIERQTLSIMKACEVVGVSRRTIYNWMAGGKVRICAYRRRLGPHLRGLAVASAADGHAARAIQH